MTLRPPNHVHAELPASCKSKRDRISAGPLSAHSSTSTLVDDNELLNPTASTNTDTLHLLKRADSSSSMKSLLNAPESSQKKRRAESPTRFQTDNAPRKKRRVDCAVNDALLQEPAGSLRMSVLPPSPICRTQSLVATAQLDSSKFRISAPPSPRMPQNHNNRESIQHPSSPISLSSSLLPQGEISTCATQNSLPKTTSSELRSSGILPHDVYLAHPDPSPSLSTFAAPSPSTRPVPADTLSGSPTPITPAAPNGETTRVEVAFDTFAKEVFYSHGQQALVEDVADAIMGLPQWSGALENYAEAARSRPLMVDAGRRKNRFVDLLNVVVDEAPRCGPELPFLHDIRFSRHDFAGGDQYVYLIPGSDSSEASLLAAREPWIDDRKAPCVGTIRQTNGGSAASAWARAAFLVDVYAPSTQDSPPESPVGPVKRKSESDEGLERGPPKRRRMSNSARGSPSIHPLSEKVQDVLGYPRLSPVEREQDWYLVRKPDTELESHASRVFSESGNRRFILAAHAKGMKVRFYMYDHAGVIFTTALDLVMDAKRIISAIISISLLDTLSLGLEPVLAAHSAMPLSDLFQTRAHSYLSVSGVSFYLQRLLHTGALYGRGCVVYNATPAVPDQQGDPLTIVHPDIPEEVVLKLSWQLPSSNQEDELLALAAQRGVRGVAKLFKSDVMDRLSHGTRGRLVPANLYADRELRVQVTGPRAIPLYEVQDLETFKTAFRSLVVAHHDLYTKAGILHRDISAGNLMVNATNHCEGLLIDFDIAARVDTCGEPIGCSVLPPAGTLYFRAHELVSIDRPRKAYYRQDLESFFYVLLWIQSTYRDGKKLASPLPPGLDFEFHGTWKGTKITKEGFLLCHDSATYEIPEMPLRDQWFVPLRRLFGQALDAKFKALGDAERSRGNPWGRAKPLDEETFGSRLTFKEFYRILQS